MRKHSNMAAKSPMSFGVQPDRERVEVTIVPHSLFAIFNFISGHSVGTGVKVDLLV